MRVSRLSCVEGEFFELPSALRNPLRAAVRRVASEIRPRFAALSEDRERFAISGIVGSISLGSTVSLEIVPKTAADDDWIRATLDLVVGTDRIDVSGERAAGLSPNNRNLIDVLAAVYAARLERALRRDGPIMLIQREAATSPLLKGKLRVSRWLRSAGWQPHRFPVSFDRFTVDHDFSRGLALVAHMLAGATNSVKTHGALLVASRELRPGCSSEVPLSRSVEARRLPAQWAAYEPAWSIAAAILARRSLLGATGHRTGFSLVIEAWPLLERLLERALSATVRMGASIGRAYSGPTRKWTVLLADPTGSAAAGRHVRPDGQLFLDGRIAATFEAKYKRRLGRVEWPPREDVFQALATAAACGAPIAVLVYPEDFPTAWWNVRGFAETPSRIAAVGLGLFGYRAGLGDTVRAERLLAALGDVPIAAALSDAGVAQSA